MKELICKLNRLKDKVVSNPKQDYSWLYEGEFIQAYSISNIKNLEEHEDNIQELLIWLWNFKDYLKGELESTGSPASVIEEKVNKDETLCLIADLANSLKHGKTKRSRSHLSPRLLRPRIVAQKSDIDAIVFTEDKVHIQLKNDNSVTPSTWIVSGKGKELGKAEDIALKAIDSWLRIIRELEVDK